MGVLWQEASGAHTLTGSFIVGRHETCDLCLHDRSVSSAHAVLRWTGETWVVQDLGSRNGTWLDGRRLLARQPEQLSMAHSLVFGACEPWSLRSDGPPGPEAFAAGRLVRGDGQTLLLSSPEEAVAYVYRAAGGAWLMDSETSTHTVRDLQTVRVNGRSLVLHLPSKSTVLDSTAELGRPTFMLATMQLRLSVSSDEEVVTLALISPRTEVVLKNRSHHYTLLTLARRRAADAHLPVAERGWIDRQTLGRMLRLHANTLNLHLFRVRQQFGAAGVVGGDRIIDVRTGTRQVRIALRADQLQMAD